MKFHFRDYNFWGAATANTSCRRSSCSSKWAGRPGCSRNGLDKHAALFQPLLSFLLIPAVQPTVRFPPASAPALPRRHCPGFLPKKTCCACCACCACRPRRRPVGAGGADRLCAPLCHPPPRARVAAGERPGKFFICLLLTSSLLYIYWCAPLCHPPSHVRVPAVN